MVNPFLKGNAAHQRRPPVPLAFHHNPLSDLPYRNEKQRSSISSSTDSLIRIVLSQERRQTGFCIILLFCASLLAIFHLLISYGTGVKAAPTTLSPAVGNGHRAETLRVPDANYDAEAVGGTDDVADDDTNYAPLPQRNSGKSRKSLRIAQIAPLEESVPPKLYGGTERVVYFLTEELVRRGHHVVLFGSADSQTSAQELVAHEPWSALLRNPVPNRVIPYLWLIEQVRRRADEFDILHFHTLEHFNIVHSFLNRSVTTLHGLLSFADLKPMFESFTDVPLISISNDQRKHIDVQLNFVATVYHGIPRNLLPFTPRPKGWTDGTPYLAFVGRITEVKRPEWAIQMAVKAGIPLKIAAKVDRVDREFWAKEVEPLVKEHSDIVEYIGEINETEKVSFMGNAIALLFPIDWAEPFGLVMIESMACGTPVVARDRGSVREVIEHGVSGLIFETLDEGVEAVRRVGRLSRQRVRRAFERRFTSEKMADNYLRVYEQRIQQVQAQQRSEPESL